MKADIVQMGPEAYYLEKSNGDRIGPFIGASVACMAGFRLGLSVEMGIRTKFKHEEGWNCSELVHCPGCFEGEPTY